MNKINIVTYPDQMHNDSYEMLLLYPSQRVLQDLQKNFLAHYEDNANVYIYDKEIYVKEELDWMLTTLKCADVVIADIDNTLPFFRDMLSYIVAKDKTYWLTNADKSVYNHISSNRIYNLEFLLPNGELNEKT